MKNDNNENGVDNGIIGYNHTTLNHRHVNRNGSDLPVNEDNSITSAHPITHPPINHHLDLADIENGNLNLKSNGDDNLISNGNDL